MRSILGYTVTFAVDDRWASGFVAGLSVTNTGERATDGWTVVFDAPFDITNIWNGTLVGRAGDRYTVARNAGAYLLIDPALGIIELSRQLDDVLEALRNSL